MSHFDLDKWTIKYLPPMNIFGPIEKRKYTLTQTEDRENFFLTVGRKYDLNAVNERLRNEVLAEWQTKDGEYRLSAKVYISGGEFDAKVSKVRYLLLKKEVELALTGMICGEQDIYLHYPWLLDCPIFVHFESVFPDYNQISYYGTPRQYLTAATKKSMSKTQA